MRTSKVIFFAFAYYAALVTARPTPDDSGSIDSSKTDVSGSKFDTVITSLGDYHTTKSYGDAFKVIKTSSGGDSSLKFAKTVGIDGSSTIISIKGSSFFDDPVIIDDGGKIIIPIFIKGTKHDDSDVSIPVESTSIGAYHYSSDNGTISVKSSGYNSSDDVSAVSAKDTSVDDVYTVSAKGTSVDDSSVVVAKGTSVDDVYTVSAKGTSVDDGSVVSAKGGSVDDDGDFNTNILAKGTSSSGDAK